MLLKIISNTNKYAIKGAPTHAFSQTQKSNESYTMNNTFE